MFFVANAGNITSKTTYTYTTVDNSALATSGNLIDVIAYTYSGDRLISYDGNAITYDTIGNPTSIQDGSNTISLTWEGRELKSYSSGDTSITYSYNADGIRTQKVVGTKTYDYIVDGSRIVAEKCGNEYLYIYIYDESGSPIGIKVRRYNQTDGEYTYYYFEKNVQGDIVAIYNESGTKIGTYTYDAWGVPTTTILSSVAAERELVTNNPFRYRGYYYDIETGFYYLQSRYYDPEIGRFLNLDSHDVITASPTELTDKNLYAYCDNNPIMRQDEDGDFWHIVAGAAIGGLFEIGSQLISSGGDFSEINWGKVAVATAVGGITAACGPATGAVVSGLGNAAMEMMNETTDVTKVLTAAGVGAGSSLLGSAAGKAVQKIGGKIKLNNLAKSSKGKIKQVVNKTINVASKDRNKVKDLIWTMNQVQYKHLPDALIGKTIPQIGNSIVTGVTGYATMGGIYGLS